MIKEFVIDEVITNLTLDVMVSILAYLTGILIFKRFLHPVTTPLLLATFFIIASLKISNISYADYYVEGSYLNTLVAPSTITLGVPFYCSLHLMKHYIRSILSGILVTCIVNTTFTILIAKTFGIKYLLVISLSPKSVTTAMVVGATDKVGGIAIAIFVVVVITGILTSAFSPVFLKLLKISDPVAIGLSLGGIGHAIGTRTALKYGHAEGTMADLAIGATGIVYIIIGPIVAQIILK